MSRDIGQEIVEAMREAVDHARGDQELKTHAVDVTGPDVRNIRARLEMSQAEFAAFCGVSVHTIRNWEQGRRQPDGPARVLLQVVDREPEAVFRALHR